MEILGVRIPVDRLMAFLVALVVIGLVCGSSCSARGPGAPSAPCRRTRLARRWSASTWTASRRSPLRLATATAALAGAALLPMYPAYPNVGLNPLYYSWYVVMLVGLGNVPGAIIGGFIVALFQTATQQFFGMSWINVVPTVIMVIVLLVAPSGIFGSEVKGVQEQ